jgi:hypothetical protein
MGSGDNTLAARTPTVAIPGHHGAARPGPAGRRRLGSRCCLLFPVGMRSTKPYLHLHRCWWRRRSSAAATCGMSPSSSPTSSHGSSPKSLSLAGARGQVPVYICCNSLFVFVLRRFHMSLFFTLQSSLSIELISIALSSTQVTDLQ